MTHTPEPGPHNSIHRLHEARRTEMRALFFERLQEDNSLRLHHANDVALAKWHQLCGQIFDVVFDRNDFFQQITPDEGQRRTEIIMHDMRALGLAGGLAAKEHSLIAQHAAACTVKVHAVPKQRAKLHRAQQPDQNGQWRNPDGQLVPHYEPGIHQTVSDMMESAQDEAVSLKIFKDRFRPMLQAMDQELSALFWKDDQSLSELTKYANQEGGYPRYAVVQAVRLDLLGKYSGLPTPLLATPTPNAPKPDAIIGAITLSGHYNVALRNALYEMAHLSIKSAYMEELKKYRDLTTLDEASEGVLQNKIIDRLKPTLNLYKRIAQENLSSADYHRYEEGITKSMAAVEIGFEGYIDSLKIHAAMAVQAANYSR